jgi:hypothetical protein
VLAITDSAGSPVTAADVNGGTTIYIHGTGFGPLSYNGMNVSLLQVRTRGDPRSLY